ncbi:MAG TPA: M28 family peptidase [bacterium]|nr:M28 family peptidase [bacterium]
MNRLKPFVLFIITGWLLMCSRPFGTIEQMADALSLQEMQSVMQFLGDDLLEGRAPGTRGGMLAEIYMQSVFKLLDLEPYEGSYFQPFGLKGYALEKLSGQFGSRELHYQHDVVGSYTRDAATFSLEGGVVFAGYGIVSEDWDWNDYKGVSVQDKILLVRVNEPGKDDPELFEGEALTYYGRWTYKIEEAARQGARGILLIHTDETAGYGWHVVQNSWSGEEVYLPSTLENPLRFRGWIREELLRDVLQEQNISLDALYAVSETREFKPTGLGINIELTGRNRFRKFETRNVVAVIRGSDPRYRDRSVVLSAHIDHLGMNPQLSGDSIFNGAIDNGSAVTSMVAAAKILKAFEKDLKYSVILLACQAEESGLLGSRYFAESIDPEKIVANINFESTPVWEAATDFMAVGARYSTLDDIIERIVHDQGLEYSSFSMSNQGFFYRSDQFSFARRGIPAVWLSAGEKYVSGENRIRDFFLGDYHTVNDEFDESWTLESTRQTIKMAVLLVDYLNRHRPNLEWKGKMTFPVDEP